MEEYEQFRGFNFALPGVHTFTFKLIFVQNASPNTYLSFIFFSFTDSLTIVSSNG